MANSQGISGAAKQAALGSIVNGKSLKGALFLASASRGPSDATYSTTGEVSGTNYPAGGVAVTNGNNAGLTGTTSFWTPSASVAFSNVTLATSFDALMIYSTTDADRNIGVFTFGATTVSGGNFTLTMPTNDASTGLVRFA